MNKIVGILKALIFNSFFWSFTALIFTAITIHKCFSTLTGGTKFDRISHNYACIWANTILKVTPGWKIHIEGQENIPQNETPMVIVANHESVVDIWILYSLGIQFRWLSKAELFKFPIIGQAMKWAGYVPIKRGDKTSHHQAMVSSRNWVKSGIPMAYFPEGTRSDTGEMKPFKIGAFKLSQETEAPVLPIVIKGAGKLFPKGSMAPNAASVKVKILPAINMLESETVEKYTTRVQAVMHDVHSHI